MNREKAKRRFVELLVNQGANVQPDQHVLVMSEPSNLDLVEYAAEFCYQRGARFVDTKITLPKLNRHHFLGATEDRRNFVATYRAVQMDQLVDSGGALIAFRSQDEPDLYEDFTADQQQKLHKMLVARSESIKRYREEGVLKRRVGWCLAGPPSPKWAAKVYPEKKPDQALEALWDDILKMTFANEEDCLRLWSQHLDRLAHRTQVLNSRGIRELHFLNPKMGTDLKVRLSAKAEWVSGRKETAQGVSVCLNIPTFEVFTTPDWRGTEGTVGLTRPAMINGTLVEGLKLTFREGEIVDVTADRNAEVYKALINTAGDPTAKRLGEVALVGTDSPIFQSGRIYQHTLYDENAACHIATGMAYTVGIQNGDKLSEAQLEELGFNQWAKTHQDVMISDEDTTVLADGEEVIVGGAWVKALA